MRYDPVGGEPLNTRGWTLQERLLSPRILHCGTEQLFWQCRVDFLSEEGSRFPNAYFNVDTIIQAQQLPLSKRGMQRIEGSSLLPGLYLVNRQHHPTTRSGRWNGGWLETVEEYSRRKLTFAKDKLPALAGLARVIATKTQDEYYAGLWRDHILEDLHWGVVATGSNQQPSASEDTLVPEAYRAPSWSWASLDSRIQFIPLDLKHAVAELIHCHIIPAGSDPYGEVIGGHIKLRVSTNRMLTARNQILTASRHLYSLFTKQPPPRLTIMPSRKFLTYTAGLSHPFRWNFTSNTESRRARLFLTKKRNFPAQRSFLILGTLCY